MGSSESRFYLYPLHFARTYLGHFRILPDFLPKVLFLFFRKPGTDQIPCCIGVLAIRQQIGTVGIDIEIDTALYPVCHIKIGPGKGRFILIPYNFEGVPTQKCEVLGFCFRKPVLFCLCPDGGEKHQKLGSRENQPHGEQNRAQQDSLIMGFAHGKADGGKRCHNAEKNQG